MFRTIILFPLAFIIAESPAKAQEGGHPLGASGVQLTYITFGTKTLPGSVAKTFDVRNMKQIKWIRSNS